MGNISPPPYPEFWDKLLYFWDKTAKKNGRGIQHKNPPQKKGNSSHFWQLWSNFWASPTFFPIFLTDNNLSSLLYSRLSSFYNFLCIFLGQNAYNTNFFTKFSHFWQLWPHFWAFPTFFPIFFQLIIIICHSKN